MFSYEPLSPSRKPYMYFSIFPLLQLLKVKPEEVLIESTGVIGHRIKKVQHISRFSNFASLVLPNDLNIAERASPSTSNTSQLDVKLCSTVIFFVSYVTIFTLNISHWNQIKFWYNRADSAAIAITTTDLVSKSVAVESQVSTRKTVVFCFFLRLFHISCNDLKTAQVGGTTIRVGGMAKGSGMIHPNMATMLGVCSFLLAA